MATKKQTTTKSRKSSGISLNKFSFFVICAVTMLYLVSAILGAIGVGGLVIVGALQGVATAMLIIIVAILAWRYIANKPVVWKVLYAICLLVVIIGIVLPLVLA